MKYSLRHVFIRYKIVLQGLKPVLTFTAAGTWTLTYTGGGFFFQLADVYTTYVLQKNIYQFDISLTVVGSTLLKQQHKNTKTSPITSLIALCINSLLQKIDLSETAVDNISWTKKIFFFFSVTQIKPVLAGLNNPYFQLFILSTKFREK